MPTGKVKFFQADKGYGFIVPDNGDKDIFVHASGLNGINKLDPDDLVEYEVGEGKKGPVAKNVQIIHEDA